MTIYEEYITYHNDYTKKYGSKTMILMEVGSFFEAYALPNSDEMINLTRDVI